MSKDLDNIEYHFPKEPHLDNFIQLSPDEVFSDQAIAFLDALSVALNKDLETKEHPDVATFAFFCRRANLTQLKKDYTQTDNGRLGKGLVFHVAPSNVPVNFAYSMVCGILAGNINVVKVPSKQTKQATIIFKAILTLSREPQYQQYTSRLILLSYHRKNSATAYFSSLCDARVIWGSDATIHEIRKQGLPAHGVDIAFGDRYSLCVINADAYMNEGSPENIATRFYNDTYLFDQNACTSPHLVVWVGSDKNIEIAKDMFWGNLHRLVKAKYKLAPAVAVGKLAAFYEQATHLEGVRKIAMPDNLIWRIKLSHLPKDIDQYQCAGGYFAEYDAASIFELVSIINSKYQTLTYYGIQKEDLTKLTTAIKSSGVDRMVPIGQSSNFSLTWDGYNMIDELSRKRVLI